MPISEKIQKEIHNLPITKDEKELMIDILKIEDTGNYKYSDDYQKRIKAYLDKHKEGDGTK